MLAKMPFPVLINPTWKDHSVAAPLKTLRRCKLIGQCISPLETPSLRRKVTT